MKAEHDPLASHIFISRRNYRNVEDTKSGKRRDMSARLSFNTACELGFLGLELNESPNAAYADVISADASRVKVRIIRTDEELMIARSVCRIAGLSVRG